MRGPGCAVMCNLINTHTHTHTHTHTSQPEAYTTYFYNALLPVAPATGPHSEALVPNLERATKLLHITQALIQSSDGCCSRQGLYEEYQRGGLAGLIDWLVVIAGRSKHKAREDTPKARRVRPSKLAHEKRGITKVTGALISPQQHLETTGRWQRYAASTQQ